MNAKEQEYMDYLIHNRMELTKQNTRFLDMLMDREKILGIAVRALQFYTEGDLDSSVAEKALKEMEEV